MVDPTADVKKDPFFIDYILYKRIKYLAQHDKDFKFKQKLSKKEKEQKKKQKDMETLRKPIEHVNLEEKLEIIKNDSFYYAPSGKRAFCKEDLETQISIGLSINSLNDNECSPCKLTNPE